MILGFQTQAKSTVSSDTLISLGIYALFGVSQGKNILLIIFYFILLLSNSCDRWNDFNYVRDG